MLYLLIKNIKCGEIMSTVSIESPIGTIGTAWDQKIYNEIDEFESKHINRFSFQAVCDKFGEQFESTMQSMIAGVKKTLITKRNSALSSIRSCYPRLADCLESKIAQTDSDSYKVITNLIRLAKFLIALPFKAACNIARFLYQVLKAAAYTIVHPLKAAMKLAKLLVKIAKELTKPETWALIGAGAIGASLGQAVMGNPLLVAGLIIGSVMLLGGLSIGAIKAALDAHRKSEDAGSAAAQYLKCLGEPVLEALMTGFFVGLIFGAIQKGKTVVNSSQQNNTNSQDSRYAGWGEISISRDPNPINFDRW